MTIVALWTRSVTQGEQLGRLGTARGIRKAMADCDFVVDYEILPMETSSSKKFILNFTGNFLRAAAWMMLPPLQCCLFDQRRLKAILKSVPKDVKCFYLDGIRLAPCLPLLIKHAPEARIVLDMDDLMSRRMQAWKDLSRGGSLGYYKQKSPTWLRSIVEHSGLSKTLIAYEAVALRRAEERVLGLVDQVVLVSKDETDEYIGRQPRTATTLNKFTTVLPPISIPNRRTLRSIRRFVFVGSDEFLQNRTTIEYLTELWDRQGIRFPLDFYGKTTHTYRNKNGYCSFRGPFDSLQDVYDGSSALLAPVFVHGGVKTKVPEAFANSAPVFGNTATFEGLQLENYPFAARDTAELLEMINAVGQSDVLCERAVEAGYSLVQREMNFGKFREKWRNVLQQTEERGMNRGSVAQPLPKEILSNSVALGCPPSFGDQPRLKN
jgi:hypothetical protein